MTRVRVAIEPLADLGQNLLDTLEHAVRHLRREVSVHVGGKAALHRVSEHQAGCGHVAWRVDHQTGRETPQVTKADVAQTEGGGLAVRALVSELPRSADQTGSQNTRLWSCHTIEKA